MLLQVVSCLSRIGRLRGECVQLCIFFLFIVCLRQDASNAATAPVGYKLAELGTLSFGDGPRLTEATSLNDGGEVVGVCRCALTPFYRAFRYKLGQMQDLGLVNDNTSSSASAINNRGEIAVTMVNMDTTNGEGLGMPLSVPRLYKCFAGHQELLKPIEKWSQVTVNCMSDDGRLLGEYYDARGNPVGFQETAAGLVRLPLPAPYPICIPEAMNASGDIVGKVESADQRKICGFVTRNGKTTILPTLGGDNAQANAINAHGVIVGSSDTLRSDDSGNPIYHAVEWLPDGRIRDLGALGGARRWSVACGINNDGIIVGASQWTSVSSDSVACVWVGRKVYNLNDLDYEVKGDRQYPSDFLDGAIAINNKGEIIGSGETPKGAMLGHPFAFVLEPIYTRTRKKTACRFVPSEIVGAHTR